MPPKRAAGSQAEPPRRQKRSHYVSFELGEDLENERASNAQTTPHLGRTEHVIASISTTGSRRWQSSVSTAPVSEDELHRVSQAVEHPCDEIAHEFNFATDGDNTMNNIFEPRDTPLSFHAFSAAFEEEFPTERAEQRQEIEKDGTEKQKTKRVRENADDPMARWIQYDRECFLKELIRLEGRCGADTSVCSQCRTACSKVYRCSDCFVGSCLKCERCTLQSHRNHPFHRIECWTGSFFERCTLKKLGLRIQVGHELGDRCLNPRHSPDDDFVVIDVTGVHEVNLDFCACEADTPKDPAIQLLRAQLYPSTTTNPKSAATFNAMKSFQLLSFESKLNSNEFVHAMERLTTNTSTHESRDRYEQFLRMIHQWRNLKMLKRAGRGHDVTGIEGTAAGECALLCPACPHPGINLPDNWQSAPEEDQYLYALFVGADGNFHLARKKVSSEERDPGLSKGWAFVVEQTAYMAHLDKNWDYKQDRSTCVNHSAVNDADKEKRGLAASGAVTIDCIRHDFKRPSGVGDLQKGERYINTDYVLFSSLKGTKCKWIFGSYDVACQFMKNINLREQLLPEHLRYSANIEKLTFFIPKFHIPAHEETCNIEFSFNLTPGVGRTDGEAPERGWSNINPLAASTKEMGPGSRRDTLDDHFNDWNWKKIIRLDKSLLTKLEKAVPEAAKHRAAHTEFENGLVTAGVDVTAWRTAVEAWEKDRRNPNPYKTKVVRKSERAVRLELTKEESKKLDQNVAEERAKTGIASTVGVDVDAPTMLGLGLELEDLQSQLAVDLKLLSAEKATPKQLTDLINRSNNLRRRIAGWMEIQAVHMPEAVIERERNKKAVVDGIEGVSAHRIPLCLPSSFPAKTSSNLCLYEWKLREGQSHDALDEVRHHLRLRSHLFFFKKKYARGVKQNTRSVNTIKACQAKVDRAVSKYNQAYRAMVSLGEVLWPSDNQEWKQRIRRLEPGDVRGLSQGKDGESEGNRTVSWIWCEGGAVPAAAVGDHLSEPGMHDSLRIEWCRSRARAMRWEEEVKLLREELRRSGQFSCYKAGWWLARARAIEGDEETLDGIKCFAVEQANMWLTLGERLSAAYEKGVILIETGGETTEEAGIEGSNTGESASGDV